MPNPYPELEYQSTLLPAELEDPSDPSSSDSNSDSNTDSMAGERNKMNPPLESLDQQRKL